MPRESITINPVVRLVGTVGAASADDLVRGAIPEQVSPVRPQHSRRPSRFFRLLLLRAAVRTPAYPTASVTRSPTSLVL